MISVLLLVKNPIIQAGLECWLGNEPNLSVVGCVSPSTSFWQQVEELRPDVVLLEGSGLSEGALLEILQALGGGLNEPVWVVWADVEQGNWVADALNRGVKAILPVGASAGEIVAAIRAAAMGLVVLAPELVEDVFVPSSRTSIVPRVPLQALTAREVEVLEMLALGLGNKAIAARLGISEHTVKFHLSSIFTKLDASSRTQAVAMGVRLGLILL
jgi:NarL family two-component system response regulator YdfI